MVLVPYGREIASLHSSVSVCMQWTTFLESFTFRRGLGLSCRSRRNDNNQQQ